MGKKLRDLYSRRQGEYVKRPEDENFLEELNQTLKEKEWEWYQDFPIEHPFLFVYGLPRSGTTLLSQLIAHSLDVGFINNLMARFYLAPLHGIRFSRALFGDQKSTRFSSDYARTTELTDIHEFGYFWRYWLKKETFTGVTRAQEIEKEIDWQGLRLTLANIQHEFGKPMVFKNIFGSYHQERLNELLEKVLYIYIKRDILDSAISILEARKKYYSDLNTWWSYMPVEYEKIKDLNYWEQIAGQVFYLRRYYNRKSRELPNVIVVEYRHLAENPSSVLEMINEKLKALFGTSIPTAGSPPDSFPFRTYAERHQEREKFKSLLAQFEERENS